MGEDIAFVAGEDLVLGRGREEAAVTADADHDRAQGREEVGQLAQRRVDDGAVLFDGDADEQGLIVQKAFGVEGRRRAEALKRGLGHLLFRADDDVDGQVVAAVKAGIFRREIALRAQPRDLALYAEDGMGHLAHNHVDLVRMGGRNHHVGIAGAGFVEDVGIARKASDALDVERFGGAADKVGVHVDDGHVVAFARKVPGDLPAHLPRAADDDLHARPPGRPLRGL